jgi:hypothetical protein
MRWLTEDAILLCDHKGEIKVETSQDFVRIEGKRVLIEPDPQGRAIEHCPFHNESIGIRPCLHTLVVKQGYSTFVSIAGKPVCLDSIQGLTDGSPPGTVSYTVNDPAQYFVEAGA